MCHTVLACRSTIFHQKLPIKGKLLYDSMEVQTVDMYAECCVIITGIIDRSHISGVYGAESSIITATGSSLWDSDSNQDIDSRDMWVPLWGFKFTHTSL